MIKVGQIRLTESSIPTHPNCHPERREASAEQSRRTSCSPRRPQARKGVLFAGCPFLPRPVRRLGLFTQDAVISPRLCWRQLSKRFCGDKLPGAPAYRVLCGGWVFQSGRCLFTKILLREPAKRFCRDKLRNHSQPSPAGTAEFSPGRKSGVSRSEKSFLSAEGRCRSAPRRQHQPRTPSRWSDGPQEYRPVPHPKRPLCARVGFRALPASWDFFAPSPAFRFGATFPVPGARS